jgi:endonuclease/exonuclease/phosphatase family metal-dependent hydrolase
MIPPSPTIRRPRLSRAVLVVALLLGAAAGGVVCALAIAVPPLQARALFLAASPAVPNKPLRFVSYNIMGNERGIERVTHEIRKLKPDFVLLQEVAKRDVETMARELGDGANAYQWTVYGPSTNILGGDAEWGNAILSKYPLYETDQCPHPDTGSFGVWGWAIVDGEKFMLASVHLTNTWKLWSWNHWVETSAARYNELTGLLADWEEHERPPLIIGGDFGQLPVGTNYRVMTRELTDAMRSLGHDRDMTLVDGWKFGRFDYLLTSQDWQLKSGGVVPTNASDHRPVWLMTAANPAPATQRVASNR